MDSCVSTLDDRVSYWFRTIFLALMAACVAGAVEAAECPSAGDVVDDTGVMMAGDFPAGCLVFVADSGGAFALDDAGGFVAGDRVAVTGTCTNIKNLCEPYGFSNLLENVTIDRAYADCGTMELRPSGCLAFRGDDGQRFLLEDDGGFLDGDRVYANGVVSGTVSPCPGGPIPTLLDNVVGPCFESVGRVVLDTPPSFGDVLFEQNDGTTYELDTFGLSRVGDFIYVEGILNTSCAMAGNRSCVEFNTTEEAFAGCGTVEQSFDCGLELVPDRSPTGGNLVLSSAEGFLVGDRVYATGRVTTSCTPQTTCSDSCLGVTGIGPCFSAPGTLERGRQRCLEFTTVAGETVAVEHVDSFDVGDEVVVKGARESESSLCSALGLDVIEDNLISRSFSGCGTLRIGFECAPLHETDDGRLFFLEDRDGFNFGDRVFVEGEITPPCLPLCPFSCVVDNTIAQTPECSGTQ